MKWIILIIITLLFSACNLTESKEEAQAKKLQEKKAFEEKIADSKEVAIKKIDAQKEQELAKIKSQTALATLENSQLLEKIKLKAKADKEVSDAKLRNSERQDSMEIKRYFLVIFFLILVIVSFFIYYYFKKRHEDKLRAYHDNLDKYFHQQEMMTKMRIAEKIIDTVASGNLEKEQESELIKALSGNISPSDVSKQIENKNDILEEDK